MEKVIAVYALDAMMDGYLFSWNKMSGYVFDVKGTVLRMCVRTR